MTLNPAQDLDLVAERRSPAALFGVALKVWALSAAFLAMVGIGAWQMAFYEHDRLFVLMMVMGVFYLGAAWWVLRQSRALDRWPVLAVVLGAAFAARTLLLPLPPVSTDVYRYVWDGRVQSAGINPYLYKPADTAVAALRDEAIYPQINRVDTAVTIYPPMAQIVFLAASKLGDSLISMKAMMVLFEIAITFALLRLLAARGLSRLNVLLYLWHPLAVFEFSGSGHVDAIAIGLMVAAMLAADAKRPFLSGMLLAAGAAAKYVPAVISPALYRRWDWRMPAGFVLAIVLLYLPYLGAGRGILGFLPGYVEEEGIAGSGIFWIALVQRLSGSEMPMTTVYFAVAGLILAGLGLAAFFRRYPDAVSLGFAMALLVAFTLVMTPHYAWYLSWLVPLLCLRPSLAVIWLTVSAPALYSLPWFPEEFVVKSIVYGMFFAILAAETLLPKPFFAMVGER